MAASKHFMGNDSRIISLAVSISLCTNVAESNREHKASGRFKPTACTGCTNKSNGLEGTCYMYKDPHMK